VESRATFESPRQYPKGIDHVVVNGDIVVQDGETTGSLPGEAIKT